MTISSETSKSGPYFGNGSTKVFDYQFMIVDASHLTVIKRSAANVETVLVLNVDYTVADVGQPAGGQITLDTAPASGETITILRNVPFTQETDLENQGAYYAETVEAAFDLMVMRDQQLSERLDRAVVIPASADASDLNELVEDVLRLADSADEIDAVAGIATHVQTVAGVVPEVTTVASNAVNINAVNANSSNINTVAANAANINTVATDIADVQTAAANMAAIQAAPGAASDAEDARDFAFLWSNEAEDVAVNDGVHTGYSTWHWYQKVLAIASSIGTAVAGAFHAATEKATPVDADELGLVDSADGWSLKKLTWANIKATLSSVFLTKTGDTMTGPLVLPASTTTATSLHIEPGIDPTAPVNGDVWVDSGGLRLRRSGSTVFLWDSSSLSLVSKADAEAGTSTIGRIWSAERVAQAIAALTPPSPQWTDLAPVATTSGTAVDWTSIPAGVTDIEIWFDKVSLSGADRQLVQLGTGGSPTTTGYESNSSWTGVNAGAVVTGGMVLYSSAATSSYTGCIRLHRATGNTWVSKHEVGEFRSSDSMTITGAGRVTLANTLDMVRFRPAGSNSFDAGSAQLRYR